jgi:hypothetical protein
MSNPGPSETPTKGQECVMANDRIKIWKSSLGGRPAPSLIGELADLIRGLHIVGDHYRPELHYMRGPGPKWHAKHDPAPVAIDNRAVPDLAHVNV